MRKRHVQLQDAHFEVLDFQVVLLVPPFLLHLVLVVSVFQMEVLVEALHQEREDVPLLDNAHDHPRLLVRDHYARNVLLQDAPVGVVQIVTHHALDQAALVQLLAVGVVPELDGDGFEVVEEAVELVDGELSVHGVCDR